MDSGTLKSQGRFENVEFYEGLWRLVVCVASCATAAAKTQHILMQRQQESFKLKTESSYRCDYMHQKSPFKGTYPDSYIMYHCRV